MCRMKIWSIWHLEIAEHGGQCHEELGCASSNTNTPLTWSCSKKHQYLLTLQTWTHSNHHLHLVDTANRACLLGLQAEQLHRVPCSEGLTLGLMLYYHRLGLLNHFWTLVSTFSLCTRPCELCSWSWLPTWSCSNHHQPCMDTMNMDLELPPLPLHCHCKHVLLQLGSPTCQHHRYSPATTPLLHREREKPMKHKFCVNIIRLLDF